MLYIYARPRALSSHRRGARQHAGTYQDHTQGASRYRSFRSAMFKLTELVKRATGLTAQVRSDLLGQKKSAEII